MYFEPGFHKSTILIEDNLSVGLAMNSASVIGVSIGKLIENITGDDFNEREKMVYPGMLTTPLPILKASQLELLSIFLQARSDGLCIVIPFSKLAQSCKTYNEYCEKLSIVDKESIENIELSGVGLVGPEDTLEELTGSLELYD